MFKHEDVPDAIVELKRPETCDPESVRFELRLTKALGTSAVAALPLTTRAWHSAQVMAGKTTVVREASGSCRESPAATG